MKKAQVISLLQQGNGASLDEIIALTGWLMHRVTVVRDGFEWQGKQYCSLLDIAKRTTGTTWSGPRFFVRRGACPESCAIRVADQRGMGRSRSNLGDI
jgi:hypothetical protein